MFRLNKIEELVVNHNELEVFFFILLFYSASTWQGQDLLAFSYFKDKFEHRINETPQRWHLRGVPFLTTK